MEPIRLNHSSLKEVHVPGKAIKLDIIAVHGLNLDSNPDHWKSTWTQDGCNWIQDLLPKKLPDARIFIYKWDSNAFFSEDSSFTTQARELLEDLYGKRKDAPRRPMLFIAHSMGGLLVKTALIWARTEEERYWDIAMSSKGIATFGTPHRGTKDAKLGAALTSLSTVLLGLPDSKNLQILQKDGEFLNLIGELFFHHYQETMLISSFWETEPFIGRRKVVKKESATLRNGHRERRIAVRANHSTMVRFKHANGAQGRLILREISILAKKILQIDSSARIPARRTKRSISEDDEGTPQVSVKTDEWEEGSFLGDGSLGEPALGGFNRPPESKETPTFTTSQLKTSTLDSLFDNPSATDWRPYASQLTPSNALCQSCQPSLSCPAHCLNCQSARRLRKGFFLPENPQLSCNRFLLSWDVKDLCTQHKILQTQLLATQRPLSGFDWSYRNGSSHTPFPEFHASKGLQSSWPGNKFEPKDLTDYGYKATTGRLGGLSNPPYPPPQTLLEYQRQREAQRRKDAFLNNRSKFTEFLSHEDPPAPFSYYGKKRPLNTYLSQEAPGTFSSSNWARKNLLNAASSGVGAPASPPKSVKFDMFNSYLSPESAATSSSQRAKQSVFETSFPSGRPPSLSSSTNYGGVDRLNSALHSESLPNSSFAYTHSSRRPSSPHERPRTTEPPLRRRPSLESVASSTISSMTTSRSTISTVKFGRYGR